MRSRRKRDESDCRQPELVRCPLIEQARAVRTARDGEI